MTSPLSGLISEVRGNPPASSGQGGLSDILRDVRGEGQPAASPLAETPAEATPTARSIAAAEDLNVAENIQALRALLGRPDISPQQRSRVQAMISRLEGPTVAGFSVGNRVEDTQRGATSNFFRGVGHGVVNYGLIGATDLVAAGAQLALPKGIENLLRIPQWREQMHEAQQIVKDAFDPEGYSGSVGTILGSLAGGAIGPEASGAQGARGAFGYLNAAGAKLIARMPVIGPRVAGMVLRGLEPGATYLERVLSHAIGSGAVDAVQVADVVSEPGLSDREKAAAVIATVALSGSVSALSGIRAIKPNARELAEAVKPNEPAAAPTARATQADELIAQGEAFKAKKAEQSKNLARQRRAARVEWESANPDVEWESLSKKEQRAIYTEYGIRRNTNLDTSQPETIVAAAIRTPDGRVAQGVSHGDAEIALFGEGELTGKALEDANRLRSQMTDGFMTNRGRFVTREEAAQIMTKFNDHEVTPEEMHSNITDATRGATRKVFAPGETQPSTSVDTTPSTTPETATPGTPGAEGAASSSRVYRTNKNVSDEDSALELIDSGEFGNVDFHSGDIFEFGNGKKYRLAFGAGAGLIDISADAPTPSSAPHPVKVVYDLMRDHALSADEVESVAQQWMSMSPGENDVLHRLFYNALDKHSPTNPDAGNAVFVDNMALLDDYARANGLLHPGDQVDAHIPQSNIRLGGENRLPESDAEYAARTGVKTNSRTDEYLRRVREATASTSPHNSELEAKIARLESEVMRERELRNVAERQRDTDPVTGYGNKAAWMRARQAVDADPNLEVTLFDVTNFKPWNDTYGFDAGDELLKDHSAAIAAAMGKADQPARIFTNAEESAAGSLAKQGDEFMAVHRAGLGDQIGQTANELAGRTYVGPYEVRLRYATGKTYSEAMMKLQEIKASETHLKARPGTDVRPEVEAVKPAEQAAPAKPKADPYKDLGTPVLPADPSMRVERLTPVVKESNEAPRMDNAEYRRLFRTPVNKLKPEELTALRQEIGRRSSGYDRATMKDTGYDKKIADIEEAIASRATGANKDGVTFYTHPGATGAVIGFAAGMSLPANDDQERFRNAIYLAGVGAIAGTQALKAIQNQMRKSIPDYQARVRGIVRSVEDAPLERRTSVETKLSRFYQEVARRDLPIRDIVKLAGQRDTPAPSNPAKMFELTGLWKGAADRWILGDRVGYYTNDGDFIKLDAATLQQIAATVNSDVRTVGDLAAARLELTLRARGKSTGMSAEDARQMFVNTPEKYHQAAEQLSKYFRALADMSVASDLLSPETRKKFDEQAFYVAIRRLFNDEPGTSGSTIDTKSHSNGGLITPEQMFKKLKGGKQPFQNPFEAAIDLTPRYMRAAELNRNTKLLFDLIEQMPVEQRKLFARRLTKVEVEKLPENAQVTAGAKLIQEDLAKTGTMLNPDEAQAIVRSLSEQSLNVTDDKVRFYRGGQAEVWQVSEPLAKALKSMTPSEIQGVIGAVVGFAEVPTKFARIGITANPAFILWQAFRDVWQFHMNGSYGIQIEPRRAGETRAQFVARSVAGTPAALLQGPASLADSAFHSIRGWMGIMMHSEEYMKYLAAGAGGESVASQGLQLVRGSVRESTDIIRKIQETPARNQFEQIAREAKQLNLRGLREAYASIMQPIADAGRFGAYLKERGRGYDVIEAIYRAKKAGANFSNRGAAPAMVAMNRITLFLNPAVQSLDATKYAFQKDPAGWVARGVAGIMIPSMLLWFAYDDDQEIREVRNTPFGSKFWWFRVNGDIVRVPKPIFDGQVFGTSIEAWLEKKRHGDPLAYQKLSESVINDVSVNLLPTIGVVPVSLMTNKVYGLGSTIVPNRTSGLDLEYQTGPETSTLSRIISRGVAPMVRNSQSDALRTAATPAGIDFMIQQIGGGGRAELARALSLAIDAQNGVQMPPKEELPFVRSAFSKYPAGATASINEFYTFADRADRATKTAQYILEHDPDRFSDYIGSREDEIMLASTYAEARKTITDYRKAIEDLRGAPRDMIAEADRRELIAEYQRLIIETARNTNELRREMLPSR